MGATSAQSYQVQSEEMDNLDLQLPARLQPSRNTSGKPRRKRQKRRSRLTKRNTYQSRMINWVKVFVFAFAALFFLLAAGLIWLQITPQGQLMMARMGRNANAQAFWTLGEEYLDHGYIQRSIQTYLKAEEAEPENPDLAKKLLLLAEAYEAAGQTTKAEEVYTRIYRDLSPQDPVAYRFAIDIMLSQDRLFEAVSLMQIAYDKTGDEGFFNQRSQLVPEPPTATLAAGRYMYSVKLPAKVVAFESSQGYEIRYTTNEHAQLPEQGTLYTEPLTLQEGTYNFRAVAVSSALVSDEMQIRYIINLPTPMAPKTNMESKTYDRPIRVSLRIIDEEDKEVDLYYTIDGSKPSLNSPKYVGEPILLPRGRVLLRAIAVNRYGKISTEMIVEYKINGSFKRFFRAEEDQFSGLALLKTTREAFVAKLGEPSSENAIADEAVKSQVSQLIYPWGEARFFQTEDGEMLYHLYTNSTALAGPRGSKVGMTTQEVTERFRDMGQLPNQKGDRGIYYDLVEGSARFLVASDDPNTGLLQYIYAGSPDSTTTILEYTVVDGSVTHILIRHLGYRMSMVQ